MLTYLVVEDNPVVIKILRHLVMSSLGCQLRVAESRAEAQMLLASYQNDIDAALVDLCLPDAANGEVVEDVLACGIPVIVLTGTSKREVRQKWIERGVVDYVTKDGRYWYPYAVKMLRRLSRNRFCRVLVVDDSRVCMNRMRNMLELHQYPVLEAATSEEALGLLSQYPDIHLMVVDHELPGMNGLELVQTVRYNLAERPLGILAVSGVDRGREQLTVDFIKSGADDFLPKPFGLEEFICRVNNNANAIESLLKLKAQAEQDFLTGLYNRRYFSMQADALLSRSKMMSSLASVDIDHFKYINDAFGHEAGDRVLQAVATEMVTRLPGVLIARTGGEEFTILMEGMSGDQALRLMEGLRVALERMEVDLGDDTLSITVSIGVCSSVSAMHEALMKEADEGLYQAKMNGRNKVVLMDPL
jgi:diguanylate cyclase (GGDEF)-like protein